MLWPCRVTCALTLLAGGKSSHGKAVKGTVEQDAATRAPAPQEDPDTDPDEGPEEAAQRRYLAMR
jgi:hypothetical protein